MGRSTKSKAATSQAIRQRAEAMIQRLIDLLDEIDGDPDFERGGDAEPVCGWTNEHHCQINTVRCTGADDEAEIDHDFEEQLGVVPGEVGR